MTSKIEIIDPVPGLGVRPGKLKPVTRWTVLLILAGLAIALPREASASQAYGTTNNFDCVNDTGSEAHGFDIELDDTKSTEITYTYDYNHYNIPKIMEDDSIPGHPRVLVRYAATYSKGGWSAYTAIPSGPIPPTAGHQFTNPNVNFGGEHFGVGYTNRPSLITYHWLLDSGAGILVHGPAVNVSTPTFSYSPPVNGGVANIVEFVAPPPPEAPPVLEFGPASWVKEIRTSTINPNKVPLEKLVGDDPGKPQPWANGETPEVEVEWSILQTDYQAGVGGGAKGKLAGAPEGLNQGDEVVTRRWEFYKYTGPIDAETGEAIADTVAADGKHGVGVVTYTSGFDVFGNPITTTVNLSTVVIVGNFSGAQMSGYDVKPALDIIAHLQDAEYLIAYPNRTVVVAGTSPFQASISSGSLPPGISFDLITGVLSGTPTHGGKYTFTVQAADQSGAKVSRTFTLNVRGGTDAISKLTVSPSYQLAGYAVRGTVRLSAPAPIGGWTVNLATSDTSSVTGLPKSMTIAAGQTTGTFQATLVQQSATTTATITASDGGSQASATVHDVADEVTGLSLASSSVKGGSSVTGTVTLATAAPAGGWTVSLSSQYTAVATVPISITIPAGQRSATFTIQTNAVTLTGTTLITAKDALTKKSVTLVVNP